MRKPEPNGRTLDNDRPLRMAPMACSRMPKWRLRPPAQAPPCEGGEREVAEKSPAPSKVRRVLHDGARSAEPPISHGTFFATALSTSAEVSRVALHFGSGGKLGKSLSQPSGSSRRCMRRSWSARSGYLLLYPSTLVNHARCSSLPRLPMPC